MSGASPITTLAAAAGGFQLAPIELTQSGDVLAIEGPSIVIARAWIRDPDAWRQLAQSVRAGTVRRFDATQLQLTD